MGFRRHSIEVGLAALAGASTVALVTKRSRARILSGAREARGKRP